MPDTARTDGQADTPAEDTPDFIFANHGSITILTPRTDAAHDWCDAHIPDDAQRYAGGIAIEPRYAENILNDIMDEGYLVA